MAKLGVMGTVFQMDIATVYTAVAQVISISQSDRGDQTFNADTLDNAADGNSVIWGVKAQTGITEPGKLGLELFLDPTNAGHQAIVGAIGKGNQNWKTTYANTSGVAEEYTSAGIKIGTEVKMGDGLKMKVDLELTGPVTQF
jgi:hypothetical protein